MPGSRSQRDVAVDATAYAVGLDRVLERAGERGAGAGRVDDLVDDADLDRLVDTTGDALVLGSQLGLDLGADVGRHLGEPTAVQDPDRRHGAHHGDLGARPGEDLRGAERARVHSDVGTAVRLAG